MYNILSSVTFISNFCFFKFIKQLMWTVICLKYLKKKKSLINMIKGSPIFLLFNVVLVNDKRNKCNLWNSFWFSSSYCAVNLLICSIVDLSSFSKNMRKLEVLYPLGTILSTHIIDKALYTSRPIDEL